MSLKVHNTLTGKLEPFEPLVPGRVGMYVCGVTVYDRSHIGHARALVTFDVIYRYLRFLGYEVNFVRNLKGKPGGRSLMNVVATRPRIAIAAGLRADQYRTELTERIARHRADVEARTAPERAGTSPGERSAGTGADPADHQRDLGRPRLGVG